MTPLTDCLSRMLRSGLADAEVLTLVADDYRQKAVLDALPEQWGNVNFHHSSGSLERGNRGHYRVSRRGADRQGVVSLNP